MLICKKCKGNNVNVMPSNNMNIKEVSILRKWGRIFLIFCTMGLWALTPKKVKHTRSKIIAICQDCGKSWSV